MRDVVQWGRTHIAYSYQFKDRKTLAIHVHPDLTVTVDAPKGTELERIQEKVLKRAAWIRKAKQEFELYLPKQPARQYINGESHRYLGRQYRIKARKARTESIRCYRGYFDIQCIGEPNPTIIRGLMEAWYWEKATSVFNRRYKYLMKQAAKLGTQESPLKICKLATRWGSCSKSGTITLNLELIKAPIECIDYVIVHELCHLQEHNHGPKFWRLVRKIIPDYQMRKRALNTGFG